MNGQTNGYEQRPVATHLTPKDFEESYSPGQEPIFPPELQLSAKLDEQYLVFRGKLVTWYRPTRLDQLLQLKADYPHAKLVVGNTEVALEMKFKHCDYPVLIHPVLVDDVLKVEKTPDALILGGAVTLSQMQSVLKQEIRERPEAYSRTYKALLEMLHWFAGKQIRNVAAIAGNIMTGSPISDLNPLFMAMGSVLTLQSQARGIRLVKMDDKFFTGYRRNVVAADEVLISIRIPQSEDDEYVEGYKQSRRREDDIAIVNGAFRVRFHPGSSRIKEASIVFGGMAPTTVMAVKTMAKLIDRKWEEETLVEEVCQWLVEELPLPPSVPGGMASYRQSLCLGFFFKFHLKVLRHLMDRRIPMGDRSIPAELIGAECDIPRIETSQSSQLFELVPSDQPDLDPVGRPLAHVSGAKHTTGQAVYCDDISAISGELYMALVLSSQAHAEILSVDPSPALALEGVRGFFSAKDIPKGGNKFGAIIHDEEVFASEKVMTAIGKRVLPLCLIPLRFFKQVVCCGQVIACVVADTQALAQRAARLVNVTYKPLEPVIITMQDAIKHGSFYHEHGRTIINGDVDQAMMEAEHVLEGTFQMAGQEHFYLETQAVIVVPKGKRVI